MEEKLTLALVRYRAYDIEVIDPDARHVHHTIAGASPPETG
jgi:hypothetical protein